MTNDPTPTPSPPKVDADTGRGNSGEGKDPESSHGAQGHEDGGRTGTDQEKDARAFDHPGKPA